MKLLIDDGRHNLKVIRQDDRASKFVPRPDYRKFDSIHSYLFFSLSRASDRACYLSHPFYSILFSFFMHASTDGWVARLFRLVEIAVADAMPCIPRRE